MKKINLTWYSYFLMLKENNRRKYKLSITGHTTLKNKKIVLQKRNFSKEVKPVLSSLFKNFSNRYLYFLIQVSHNLTKHQRYLVNFKKIKIKEQQLIELARNFYNSFEDPEITKASQKILHKKKKNLQFINKNNYIDNYGINGVCYFDLLFEEAYCLILKNDNLKDLFTLVHEVGHGIDFLINPRALGDDHYGFDEVIPYTFELLLLDYLKENNLFKDYLKEIEINQKNYPLFLAKDTMTEIKKRVSQAKQKEKRITNLKGKISLLNIKELTTINSYLMARLMAKKVKEDKKNGINLIKLFITNPPSSQEYPHFEYLGISNEDILDHSLNYSKTYNKSL